MRQNEYLWSEGEKKGQLHSACSIVAPFPALLRKIHEIQFRLHVFLSYVM